MYQNQNLGKELMEMVRAKYPEYKKNAVMFFKEKMKCCYSLRLGEMQVAKYHMRIGKGEIEAINQERKDMEAQRQQEEQIEEGRRREAANEERVQREIEERVQREVEERVAEELRQRRIREEGRQDSAQRSPARRRRNIFDEEHDEGEGDVVGQQRHTPAPTMSALVRMGDPNSSVLEREPAALAVVRAPGASRPARILFKCPYGGCSISRSSEEALQQHVENSHD